MLALPRSVPLESYADALAEPDTAPARIDTLLTGEAKVIVALELVAAVFHARKFGGETPSARSRRTRRAPPSSWR